MNYFLDARLKAIEEAKNKENEAKKLKRKSTKKKKEDVMVGERIFIKIPHKDGDQLNVGNPLSKSFLSKIEEGVMSSIPKTTAKLALKYHRMISYWENNTMRIK